MPHGVCVLLVMASCTQCRVDIAGAFWEIPPSKHAASGTWYIHGINNYLGRIAECVSAAVQGIVTLCGVVDLSQVSDHCGA